MLTPLDTKSQALFIGANPPERGTCIHYPFHRYTIPDRGTGQLPVGKKDLYCPQAPPSHPINDQHSICSPPLLPSLWFALTAGHSRRLSTGKAAGMDMQDSLASLDSAVKGGIA